MNDLQTTEVNQRVKRFERFLDDLLEMVREFQGNRQLTKEGDKNVIGEFTSRLTSLPLENKKVPSPFECIQDSSAGLLKERDQSQFRDFIMELTSLPLRNDGKEKASWNKGCRLAVEHIKIYIGELSTGVGNVGYVKRRYNEEIKGLGDNDRHQIVSVCGYIAQGRRMIKVLNNKDTNSLTDDGDGIGLPIHLNANKIDEAPLEPVSKSLTGPLIASEEDEPRLDGEKAVQHVQITIDDANKGEKVAEKSDTLMEEKVALESEIARLCIEREHVRAHSQVVLEKAKQLEFEIAMLEELKRELAKEIDQINAKYLSSVGLTAYCLGLSRATLNNYQSILTALAKEYQRDATDGYIMMSLFWKTCFENILRSLVEERIRSSEEDKKDVCETHYEEIFVSLIEIGNIVTNSLSKFDMWRKKIHSPSDYDEVRAISRTWIEKVLDPYKAEGDAGLDRVLEQEVPSSLAKVVAEGSPLATLLVNPLLCLESQTTSRKIVKTAVLASLHGYLRRYGRFY